MAAPFCGPIVYSHMTYASLFGFFTGGCVGLTSVIAADMLDRQNVSSGLGILFLFQGIATSIGTPIVGKMTFFLIVNFYVLKVQCVMHFRIILNHIYGHISYLVVVFC
jgi:MFS family permease